MFYNGIREYLCMVNAIAMLFYFHAQTRLLAMQLLLCRYCCCFCCWSTHLHIHTFARHFSMSILLAIRMPQHKRFVLFFTEWINNNENRKPKILFKEIINECLSDGRNHFYIWLCMVNTDDYLCWCVCVCVGVCSDDILLLMCSVELLTTIWLDSSMRKQQMIHIWRMTAAVGSPIGRELVRKMKRERETEGESYVMSECFADRRVIIYI